MEVQMVRLHRVAGVLALALVTLFWLATVLAELAGTREAIAMVKQAIAWGLLLLVPTIIAANGTGWRLTLRRRAGNRALPPLLTTKLRRGIAVAALGLLVLVPSALWLAAVSARPGPLPDVFFAVQALELAAGATNATLLMLNARDGYRMRAPQGQTRRRKPPLLERLA
jgi:hypothetical protein